MFICRRKHRVRNKTRKTVNVCLSLYTTWRPTQTITIPHGYVQNERHVTSVFHSRCSIFTLGGFRNVRFFFSFLVLPLAWKFLQLSTRPSRVSWGEKTHDETWSFTHTSDESLSCRTSKFFCHSRSLLARSCVSISSSLCLFLQSEMYAVFYWFNSNDTIRRDLIWIMTL